MPLAAFAVLVLPNHSFSASSLGRATSPRRPSQTSLFPSWLTVKRTLPVLLLSSFLLPGQGFAQDAPKDPAETAKMRVGPLAATPSIALTNVGVDTNVFNEWIEPKQDWTATATPKADMWLRLGRARMSATASGSFVYFANYSSERSLNTDDAAKLELPLLHVRPYAGITYLNRRERPGFEIDNRVRREETGLLGGVDFPLTRKTTIGFGYRRTRVNYGATESFNGTYLRDVFNRATTVATGSLRYALTPLTTIVLDVERVRERFEFSEARDSNSVRVVPGVEFGRYALINGNAHFGVRRLKMLSPGMPDYTGPVAAVNLGYTLLGMTRFAVGVDRDVAYSFETTEPYYLLTGITGSVTQAVGGPWDVVARAGTQRLAYQSRSIGGADMAVGQGFSPAQQQGRTDTVRFYGGGFGYKLGPDVRLGFNADYYRRSSDRLTREYKGLRAGTSVTYGF